jgi:hypothetical protein
MAALVPLCPGRAVQRPGARDRMTDMSSHPRGLFRPSFASSPCPLEKEGAGKTGRRLAPAVHCAKLQSENLHSGIQVKPKRPAFPAQRFYGLCRALPGERCTIAPVASQMTDTRARLSHTHHHETWRTDPGRQDHTILPYAGCTGRARAAIAHGVTRPATTFAPMRPASTTSHPACRDDRDAPLGRVGMAGI